MRLKILLIRVFIALIIVELGMRIFGVPFSPPSLVRQQSVKYVPAHFGGQVIAEKPQEVSFSPIFKYKFGNPVYPINAQGFRGHPAEIPKPKGKVRILFVGASSVFDVGASEFADWPSQVGEELRKTVSPEIEVLNFGTPGTISYDIGLRMISELDRFQPDFVVFQNIWSEIKYFHIQRPLYRIGRSTRMNLFADPPNRVDDFFAEHSHLYSFFRTLYLRDHYGSRLLGTPPIEDGSGVEKLDGPSEIGASQFRHNMEFVVDAIRTAGAVPILMSEHTLVADGLDEVGWEKVSKENSRHFKHKALVECFRFANETLASVAKEKKVEFLSFNDQISGKTEYFFDHVHLTAEGGKVLSHLVAEKLRPILSRKRR